MNRTVDGQGYSVASDGTWKRNAGTPAPLSFDYARCGGVDDEALCNMCRRREPGHPTWQSYIAPAIAANGKCPNVILAVCAALRTKPVSLPSMVVGVRYIVTKASADKEFQVGDRVQLLADGSITNHQAAGWMDAEDVPTATRGWKVEIDAAWIEARRSELARQLAALNASN